MKVTLPKTGNQNAINHGGKKEKIVDYKGIAYEPRFKVDPITGIGLLPENPLFNPHRGNFQTVIDCRVYASRSADGMSPIYASIWIHGNGHETSGTGSASGCGYRKPSQAIAQAIESAGVTLEQDIGGRGDTAIREALTAIAQAMGYNDIFISEA